jgi:hypothetical protein
MADSGFARFMSSPAGRILRVVVGLALIAWGGTSWGTTAAIVEVVVGVVFVFVGAFDICLLAGLFGGVWSGKRIRARAAQQP